MEQNKFIEKIQKKRREYQEGLDELNKLSKFKKVNPKVAIKILIAQTGILICDDLLKE